MASTRPARALFKPPASKPSTAEARPVKVRRLLDCWLGQEGADAEWWAQIVQNHTPDGRRWPLENESLID